VPRLEERVIVCGVAKTVGSNWMRLPSGLGSASAWLMAYRRSPVVPEPEPAAVGPLSVVRSTVYYVGK
jgi:hypothetical protein